MHTQMHTRAHKLECAARCLFLRDCHATADSGRRTQQTLMRGARSGADSWSAMSGSAVVVAVCACIANVILLNASLLCLVQTQCAARMQAHARASKCCKNMQMWLGSADATVMAEWGVSTCDSCASSWLFLATES